MPEGPAGLTRPLADDVFKIKFSILTVSDIANTFSRSDVQNIAEQSLAESLNERVSDDKITGSSLSYDSKTNNLFVSVGMKAVSMSLLTIKQLVRDVHRTMANIASTRLNISLNTQTLDDLPPDQDTFILVDQGELDKNIVITS